MFQSLPNLLGRLFYFVDMLIPDFLKPSDKVAVVATAKRLEKSIEQGVNTLENWGLEVIAGKNLNKQAGYFAGTDDERISDAQLALDNPDVKAIIFARGGYGTTRILDKLDFTAFQKSPKWLVGFSDLTSMLLQASSLSIPSIHGPVCITIGQNEETDNFLRSLLFGQLTFDFPLKMSSLTRSGEGQGKIVGGNLTLICESMGAPNEIQTSGNILFLEEVGEGKYSLDRMMNKLKRCGKLDQLTGVIIGDFSDISDQKGYFHKSTEELLMSYFEPLKIPVAFGLSAGHEKANYPLVIGMEAVIHVNESQLRVHYLN